MDNYSGFFTEFFPVDNKKVVPEIFDGYPQGFSQWILKQFKGFLRFYTNSQPLLRMLRKVFLYTRIYFGFSSKGVINNYETDIPERRPVKWH